MGWRQQHGMEEHGRSVVWGKMFLGYTWVCSLVVAVVVFQQLHPSAPTTSRSPAQPTWPTTPTPTTRTPTATRTTGASAGCWRSGSVPPAPSSTPPAFGARQTTAPSASSVSRSDWPTARSLGPAVEAFHRRAHSSPPAGLVGSEVKGDVI